MVTHHVLNDIVIYAASPIGLDGDGRRLGPANNVGELNLAALGDARGDDVLGDVTGHVRAGAVDLRGVLAGERATPVLVTAAVGVDENLASGQAGVGFRASLHKAPGGVDVVLGVLVHHAVRDDLTDNEFAQIPLQGFIADLRVMLGSQGDAVDAGGHAVLVFDGDLRLAVRTQVRQLPITTDSREFRREKMGEVDGHWHEGGCFGAGESNHGSLVARAEPLDGVGLAFAPDLFGYVDTALDVRRLLIDGDDHAAGVEIEAVLGVRIAHVAHGVAHDGLDIDVGVGRDFARDKDESSGYQGLAGDAAFGVLGEDGVKNGIGYLVTELIRVALRNGFSGLQKRRVAQEAEGRGPHLIGHWSVFLLSMCLVGIL